MSAAPKSPAKAASNRLLDKVAEAARELGNARQVAHQAQVREASTRAELTLALTEALIARSEAEALRRGEALRRYVAEAAPTVSHRIRRRPVRMAEQVLARLGSFGQGALIAWSGVWRGTGRRGFDLRHMAAYARRRADPTVQPLTLFDQAWYLAAYPDVAAARTAPLVHYLRVGPTEDRQPHPLFDAGWYRSENAAALAATGLSPLEHYLRAGAAQGRSPHPLFDVGWYVAQASDLTPAEDPLSHYLRVGWRRGLSPHPLFDPAWYRAGAPRSAREVAPLVHYVAEGWRKGIAPHPLFDPAWYLQQNPDVAAAGLEPLAHFITLGGQEGRSPSAWFDLAHYVSARGEALINPLVDYLQGGAWRIVEARPGFPTAAYLAQSPDLVRQGLTPLEHWARRHPR